MLDYYFIHLQTLRKFRIGPIGPHMDDLAEKYFSQGYSKFSARELLRQIAHLSRYAMWCGIYSSAGITPELVNKFLKEHIQNCFCERKNSGIFSSAASAAMHVLSYLQEKEIIKIPEEPINLTRDSIAGILACYQNYLNNIRGLTHKSQGMHIRIIRRFLDYRLSVNGDLALSEITGKEVLEYVSVVTAEKYSLDWKTSVISCTRTFLRFLCWERIQDKDLSQVVPSVIKWKLADIPKHIPFDDVQKLVNAPDRNTAIGKRDRAILILLAVLGLRACEILSLNLDCILWRENKLIIPEGKPRKERMLPLTSEISESLYDYIKNGRPQIKQRKIFIRTIAPIKAISTTGTLVNIVRKYIHQTNIDAPKKGTHLLRHSLATKLVNSGVSIKEIADIMGHESIEAARIYTKLDLTTLNDVAMPFPELEVK